MNIDFLERLKSYDKNHCWQYEMRLQNLKGDLELLPIGFDYRTLKVKDFEIVPLTTPKQKADATNFIKRHEWLGKLSMNTTHYFGAYYNDILAGVVTMGMPNAFSKLVGEDTKELERLISRGACISWSPKHLASHMIMWCIKWMVQNTQYRVFTAYSDPTAKELGTIYQSCNFYYLGNHFGTQTRYISPYTNNLVSDRCFRCRSFYKQYAKELGVEWQANWSKGDKIFWENIPNDIEQQLREMSKIKQRNAQKIVFPSKHKYVYILGKDKRETKRLLKEFFRINKIYDYPKERVNGKY